MDLQQYAVLCTGILLLTKSPLPFCALFGCLTNSVNAFAICTIASKLKRPTYIGLGFSSIGTGATLQKARWMRSLV